MQQSPFILEKNQKQRQKQKTHKDAVLELTTLPDTVYIQEEKMSYTAFLPG